jgi:hypothetical protein
VAPRRTADAFVISLPFGAEVDWLKNLRAAEGGVIRWKGADYPVGAPEINDWPAAQDAFNPVQQALLRRAGIKSVVRLRDR